MRVNRVEQHRIKKSHKFFPIIDELCWKSKNMYNYGNYIVRQEFIETSKEKEQGLRENAVWIQYNKLFDMVKESEPYKELGSNLGQATLRKLDKVWKSYFEGVKAYKKNPREIANEMEISRSYVSRIEKKALEKLKTMLQRA